MKQDRFATSLGGGHVIGEKLIYKLDGRIVEFRGYAENDPDGAYIYPLTGYGGELYVSIRQLETINQ